MKWPSFESLIVTFITFLALSPCMIYFMTTVDDNGSSSMIRNLFYLGMNLTLVSAILWAIHKKFMEDPPIVLSFYRKMKQYQQSRQQSSTSSNQWHSGEDGDSNSSDSSTSKRRYFRKNKRFRKGKRIKLSKWVSRKRPCGKRFFVGYLGIIMSLITTATALPVMVEGLENSDGYSDNLQRVTCLDLLSFLSILFLAVVAYRYRNYTENWQQQHSSSVFEQGNSASMNNANTNVASGSDPSQLITRVRHKMRLPCLDTIFICCMPLVIFSPCSLSLAIAVDMNHGRIKNYFALGFFLTSVSAIFWVVGRCCSELELYHDKLLLLKAKEEAAALTQPLKRDDDTTSDPTSDNSKVEDKAKSDDDTTIGTTCSGPSSMEQKAKRDDDTTSDPTGDANNMDETKINLLTMEELAIAQKNALLHTLTDQEWDDPDDTPRLWTKLEFAFPNKVHYVSFTCSFKYQGDGNCKGLIKIMESPEEEEDVDGAEKTIIYLSPCAEDDWTDLKCDFEVKSKKKYSLWYKMGGGDHDELHVRNASVRKMNRSKFEALVNTKPIRSSYSKKTDIDGNPGTKIGKEVFLGEEVPNRTPNRTPVVFLGKEVPLKHTANGASYRSMNVELRGITIRQLRELKDLALQLCVEEAWYDWKGNRVTPESMNLYDVVKYIVKPFTEATRKSFVESLPSTAGTQPPHWYLSHWWGEPFPLTMDCLEQFIEDFRKNEDDLEDARGGGMTEDTPIWICAFANNQWDLKEDMADDPKESSFAKAMHIACFRTVSILDANGVMLTRLWCNYEQYLVHILAKKKGVDGLMTFYTAHRHMEYGSRYCANVAIINGRNRFKDWSGDRAAVGIIPGKDCKYFPFHRIFNALPKIDIRSAKVSFAADGRLIKNSIAGMDTLNAEPPADHKNYDILNNEVKASLVYPPAVLAAAHKAGREVWESTLEILSKGTMTGTFQLDFKSFPGLTTSLEARELVCHVPLTCTDLDIDNADGDACEGAIEGLLEWLEKKEANSLTFLWCYWCKVCAKERGRVAGSRLAAALASNHAQSMEELKIGYTDWINSGNVSDWALALEAMPNLKALTFHGSGLSKKEEDILKNATHAELVWID